MKKEQRFAYYDNDIQIEAHHFKGIMQMFPNHFHEYYVIGFIESGRRFLTCKNKEYIVGENGLIIFNPYDNHACHQISEETLDWRSLNIDQDIMKDIVKQITRKEFLPEFRESVIIDSDMILLLKELHDLISNQDTTFRKEEILYLLIDQLIKEYAQAETTNNLVISDEIQKACDYMDENYAWTISLYDLSNLTNLNKYTLIRNFTKQKGVTPYQYLETIRISKAKRLLEQGYDLSDIAIQTGFVDQSHFSKFFKKLIGLTPKQYADIFK